jgi:predicted ester cyclase
MGNAEDHRLTARRALERVCTGGEPGDAARCYREDFLDHVNGLEFSGLEGVEQSVSLYRQIFPRLEIAVEDQIAEGDRVATRWTMRGTTAEGSDVELRGITISRFVDGRIKEDWTHFDSAVLTRQLEGSNA